MGKWLFLLLGLAIVACGRATGVSDYEQQQAEAAREVAPTPVREVGDSE